MVSNFQKFKSGISDKTDIIVKNRWDINNGMENEEVNKLHQEYGRHYDKDNFYVLLQAFIKTIPNVESTWICKVCNEIVEDEKDENDVDIPHPACEICFEWYHVVCTGIDAETLKDSKNIFLCSEHSEKDKCVTRAKRGFKY